MQQNTRVIIARPDDPASYLNSERCAAYLGISRRALFYLKQKEGAAFPAGVFFSLSKKEHAYYERAAIHRWLQAHPEYPKRSYAKAVTQSRSKQTAPGLDLVMAQRFIRTRQLKYARA